MTNNNKIKLIQEIVGKYLNYDFKVKEQNKSRLRANVEARMLYFYLCRDLTPLPLSAIGETIKPRKDHATVLHACTTLKNLISYDRKLSFIYNDIYNTISKTLKDIKKNHTYSYEEQMLKIQELEEQNREMNKKMNSIQQSLKSHARYLRLQGYEFNKSNLFKILNTRYI